MKDDFIFIEGGICAPAGFAAGGLHCGIRKNRTKSDLALIYSKDRCAAAAVYTQNLVKGAPIALTKENIADGYAHAVVCNSGNANTCNLDGPEKARLMCEYTASALGISLSDVIVASTGVIGQPINVEPVKAAMPSLAASLTADAAGSNRAAEAIMTTDTTKKEFAVEFLLGGKRVRLGGIAKGSGMIMPNMATMLCFITTDAAISPDLLSHALKAAVRVTFNRVSVDGDTSTNDMLSALANGRAGNEPITATSVDFYHFTSALTALCRALCREVARDGEGATKLLECRVKNFRTEEEAGIIAKGVINSSLVKAAFFGADANCGRILCAVGNAGILSKVDSIDVTYISAAGSIKVCEGGAGLGFDEEKAKKVLLESEITIDIDMHDGGESATAWGCDLTYDYVKINGDYRT